MRARFLGKTVWTHLDRFACRSDRKSLAVAYISSTRNFQFAKGDEIIANASVNAIRSRQTSASLLLKAARQGARVYSLEKLHAKIFWTPKLVIAGSANISASSRTLCEAAIVTTDRKSVTDAKRYIQELRARATPLGTEDLVRLTKVPIDPVSFQTKHRKPSLLDALDKGSSALEDVAFIWCYADKLLPASLVRRHAHRKKIPLPSGDEWEWFESTYSNDAFASARRHYEGRPLVVWKGKLSDDGLRKLGRITGLHKSHAVQTIEISRIGKCIVHFVKTTPHTSPFDLKAQRRALVGILNSGLTKNPAIAQAIGSDPVGIVKAHQLRKLYRAGIPAA